eukprot:764933-Hanusia_phi.AAC.3
MLRQLLGNRWSLTSRVDGGNALIPMQGIERLEEDIVPSSVGVEMHETLDSWPSSASRSRDYDEVGVNRLSSRVQLRLEHRVFRFWAFFARGVASMKGLKNRCERNFLYPFFWNWTLFTARSMYTKRNDHSRALKFLQIAYNKWARFHFRIRAIKLAMLQKQVHQKKFLATHVFSWSRILQRRKAQLRARKRWMMFEMRQVFLSFFEQVLRIKTLAKTSQWIRKQYILFTLDRACRAWRYNRLLDKKNFSLVQSTIQRWLNYVLAAHFFTWMDNVLDGSSHPIQLAEVPSLLPPIVHKYGKASTVRRCARG